jgi:hypothetical protein
MPHWLIVTLLVVFVVHFIIFTILTIKNLSGYYCCVAATFFLLIIAYSLRLWAADWRFAGIKIFWYFRIAAWSMACISLYLTIRSRMRAKKKET